MIINNAKWTLKNGEEITVERLDKLELTGMSEQSIAELLGITRQYLHRVRKRMGWPQTTRSDKGVEKIPADEKKRKRNKYIKEYRKRNLDKFKYKIIRIGKRQISEHRHVMEQHLGRKLLKTEIVHHIDNDRLNNVNDNLQVMTIKEHIQYHNRLRYGCAVKMAEAV